MKPELWPLLAFALLGSAAAQERRPYVHPDLDFGFSAFPGWQHRPRPGDRGTHERIDPETGIHVLLWSTTTETSAARYLEKMSHMMDLDLESEGRPVTIGVREAWMLDASRTVEGTRARTYLAVIPSGKSLIHPAENQLYIVQIWCPVDDHRRLAERMDRILASVRVTDRVVLEGREVRLYPVLSESPFPFPSPLIDASGEEVVTVRTQDGRYGLVVVTVENGEPNDYDAGQWGKGRQLDVAESDFPTLARTGLHAETELDRASTITGRPVEAITADAKPGQASRSGFVAEDEDLLSVIRSDNRLVGRLGLTHWRLARPLFAVFNVILRDLTLYKRGRLPISNIRSLRYNGHEITIEAEGGKGWQKSIFADEVCGYWSIVIRRDLTSEERHYLQAHYGHLSREGMDALADRLTRIHFSEMVPFYIQRYGFYEGHTDWRADPISIAGVFGLMSLEELDAAVGDDLPGALSRHYTSAP